MDQTGVLFFWDSRYIREKSLEIANTRTKPVAILWLEKLVQNSTINKEENEHCYDKHLFHESGRNFILDRDSNPQITRYHAGRLIVNIRL